MLRGAAAGDSALLRPRTMARARLAVLALRDALGFRASSEIKDLREPHSIRVARRRT